MFCSITAIITDGFLSIARLRLLGEKRWDDDNGKELENQSQIKMKF